MVAAISRTVHAILVALVVLLVACVIWQVLSRYLLSDPSSWTEELARFAMVWVGVLGASQAYYANQHLGMDVLANGLSVRGQLILNLASRVAVFFFAAGVMVWGGCHLILMTLDLHQVSPALGIPMAWVYSVVPISGVVIALYAVSALRDIWSRRSAAAGEC